MKFFLLGLWLFSVFVYGENSICQSKSHIYEKIDCYESLNKKLNKQLDGFKSWKKVIAKQCEDIHKDKIEEYQGSGILILEKAMCYNKKYTQKLNDIKKERYSADNRYKNITIQQSCNSDAYYNSYIRFDDNGKSHIAIQSSQIIINTSIKIKDKKISFYFHSVKDLGRGGVQIDWGNISKSKEVLRLTALDGKQNTYKIKWYGLYDAKTKKHLTKSLFEIETPIFKACELNSNGEWQDIKDLIKVVSTEVPILKTKKKVISDGEVVIMVGMG